MTDSSKLNDIPEQRLLSLPDNQFDQLCACSANGESCMLGLFFPCCLFGRTYERARYGSFFSGCCKYFAIQLIFGIIISAVDFDYKWAQIYGPEFQFTESIKSCGINPECKPSFNGTKLVDSLDQSILANNNCNVPVYLDVCKCLLDILPRQCQFIEDMPETIKDNVIDSIVINTIGGFVSMSTLGCFLGYYRKKISATFGIESLSSENFFYHCLPCLNPCALCQEANTVDRLNFNRITIMPTNTVNA